MTPKELAAIEERAAQATPGPWETEEGSPVVNSAATGLMVAECYGIDESGEGPSAVADAAFIAEARQDVPALVARVRELDARLAHARDLRDLQAVCVSRLGEQVAVLEAEVVRLRGEEESWRHAAICEGETVDGLEAERALLREVAEAAQVVCDPHRLIVGPEDEHGASDLYPHEEDVDALRRALAALDNAHLPADAPDQSYTPMRLHHGLFGWGDLHAVLLPGRPRTACGMHLYPSDEWREESGATIDCAWCKHNMDNLHLGPDAPEREAP